MKQRYELQHYKPAKDQPLCQHGDRIPGLDADTCSVCGLVWSHRNVSGRVEYHGILLEQKTLLGAIAS